MAERGNIRTGPLLFVPSVKRGNGTGHLRRCFELAEKLDATILAPWPAGVESVDIAPIALGFPSVKIVDDPLVESWRAIVIDRRETKEHEAKALANLGHLIGIDEGGQARDRMSFLVDTLPILPGLNDPNLASRGYLTLPERHPGTGVIEQVLISFGGEDPGSLTLPLCRSLIHAGIFPPGVISVTMPWAGTSIDLPGGVRRLGAVQNLRERLTEYDLVFTSFGLTAYEAAAAGCGVVLINPTPYHQKLGSREGFFSLGVRPFSAKRMPALPSSESKSGRAISKGGVFPASSLRRKALQKLVGIMAEPDVLRKQTSRIVPVDRKPLWRLFEEVQYHEPLGCPVCGSSYNEALERFPSRSYFRCSCTGIVYQVNFSQDKIVYDEGYFFEEYRKQYGKTYLEDFDNIRKMGARRLDEIGRLVPIHGTPLLDVGCAYGAFLAEARARGASCYGVDLAEEAVNYLQKSLGIQGRIADFTNIDSQGHFGLSRFGIITMWFVIEHFEKLGLVMERVAELLPRGGVFAFSTPNMSGISGQRDRKAFLDASPPDHMTVLDPKNCRALLARYGLRVKKIKIIGHHPERFPLIHRDAWAWLRPTAGALSRILGLGDSFEVYAVKE